MQTTGYSALHLFVGDMARREGGGGGGGLGGGAEGPGPAPREHLFLEKTSTGKTVSAVDYMSASWKMTGDRGGGGVRQEESRPTWES